ncbi:kinase-like domain-containing protein [Earliella scabrosa]|nr:kinase-like domain-containing protein [Earliella scabrosa]
MENSPPQHLDLPNPLQHTGTRDWRQLTTMVMTNSYYNDPSSHPSTSAVTLDSPTWYPPYNYWDACPLAPSNTPQGPLFPPTKVTLVPAPVSYAYLASACSTLPYPITASHLHNATLSGLPHGQPKPLPRPGAPARPSAQRLHAARMQPFPTRHQLSDVRTQLHPHALAQVRPPTMSHVSWQVAADHSPLAVPGTYAQMPLYVRPGYRIARPAPCPPRFDQLHHAGLTFTVIYRLGEGSAGRVVLGEHAKRLYAIKAIHPRRAARTHTHRDYFLREREVMIRIGHSASSGNGARTFLVPLLMSWEEEGAVGRIFFVMPFYPIDMHAALKMRQPMTMKDRYLYCQELICALGALRELGIVHHDIKPSNILINTHGQAYLTDFGMARLVPPGPPGSYESWRRAGYSGTYAYMAPEMVREGWYGAGVDVWSMGLAFLEILGFVRERYFAGAESREAARKAHEERLPVVFATPEGFDPAFARLVSSMLEVDQEKRMTARELQSKYVSSCSWATVRKGLAVHDWMPSMAVLPKRHAGRCLDFPTFCANDDADADVDAYTSAKRNPAEFEYCAPGAFM